MKGIILVIITLCTISSIVSCSDKEEVIPDYVGTWERSVYQNEYYDIFKYFEISKSHLKIYFETQIGGHIYYNEPYTSDANILTLESGFTFEIEFSDNGDTIKIDGPDGIFIGVHKVSHDDLDNWVSEIEISDPLMVNSPNLINGICSSEEPAILLAKGEEFLFEIDKVSGDPINQRPFPNSNLYSSLENLSNCEYLALNRSLNNISSLNCSTLELNNSIIDLGLLPQISAICSNGERIWGLTIDYSAYPQHSIIELDMKGSLIAESMKFDLDPDGIAYGDGSLWILSSNGIFKVNPTTLRTDKSYQITNVNPNRFGGTGIEFSHGVIWFLRSNPDFANLIYSITPD